MRSRFSSFGKLLGAAALPLAACALALLGLTALFDAFDQRAEADPVAHERTEDESPGLERPLLNEAPRPAGVRPLRQRDPFAPYPADPGALRFDELSSKSRAEVEATQEWAEADSGYAVHHAFKRASALGVVRARARSAERAVDLVGAANLGVN